MPGGEGLTTARLYGKEKRQEDAGIERTGTIMYFKMDNLNYRITDSDVMMEYINNKIRMYIEIRAEATDETEDFDMRKIRLYHHNGFSTDAAKPSELTGKTFVWECEGNEEGDDAGYVYVGYHDPVSEGTIEVLAVTAEEITLRWHGIGCGLAFDTEFTAKLPEEDIYTINGWESLLMPIGEDATLELLNFPEYEEKREAVCESHKWETFHAVLKFKVRYQEKDYFGEVVYTNGKINFETHFDAACPLEVRSTGCGWDPAFGHIDFSFSVRTRE